MSAEAAGAGALLKFATALGAGVLGAAIMAAVDPPATRRELFKQALAAGVGSLVFGPGAIRLFDHWVDWVSLANAPPQEYLEWATPIFFLVGAMAWGAFGALAKLRVLVRERAAGVVADKVGLK